MRDLDLAVADRDEALVGEHGEDAGDDRVAVGLELVERARRRTTARRPRPRRPAAAGSARAVSRWRRVEPGVGALGEPGDRAVHAAGALVGAQAQRAAVAVLPQLEQRARQQRQAAGLALDVGDQRVAELRLDAAGRRGGRAARSRAAARRGASGRRARGWRRAAAPARDMRRSGRRSRRARRSARAPGGRGSRAAASSASDERRALGLVAAGGEDLLELVDRDHLAARGVAPRDRVERAQRMLAGAQQRRSPTPRSRAARRPPAPRSSPARSADDLPLPDGADDAHQRRAGEPRDHLGDQPLAAEEQRRRPRRRRGRGP